LTAPILVATQARQEETINVEAICREILPEWPVLGKEARRGFHLQLEGDAPEELLALISNNERYASNASLTAVGSTIVDGERRAQLATDFQGKVVSQGTSFELIAGVLWRTACRYERYIGALEGRYRLSTNPCDSVGLQISGEIATLELQRHIPDLELFLDGLFSCRAPFRLWAVPREVASEQWEANAVDLHVGHPLRIEITPAGFASCSTSTPAETRWLD
jgi:hypothetical protein